MAQAAGTLVTKGSTTPVCRRPPPLRFLRLEPKASRGPDIGQGMCTLPYAERRCRRTNSATITASDAIPIAIAAPLPRAEPPDIAKPTP